MILLVRIFVGSEALLTVYIYIYIYLISFKLLRGGGGGLPLVLEQDSSLMLKAMAKKRVLQIYNS